MIFPKTVLGKTMLIIGALGLILFNASLKSIKKEEVELEDAAKRPLAPTNTCSYCINLSQTALVIDLISVSNFMCCNSYSESKKLNPIENVIASEIINTIQGEIINFCMIV